MKQDAVTVQRSETDSRPKIRTRSGLEIDPDVETGLDAVEQMLQLRVDKGREETNKKDCG